MATSVSSVIGGRPSGLAPASANGWLHSRPVLAASWWATRTTVLVAASRAGTEAMTLAPSPAGSTRRSGWARPEKSSCSDTSAASAGSRPVAAATMCTACARPQPGE